MRKMAASRQQVDSSLVWNQNIKKQSTIDSVATSLEGDSCQNKSNSDTTIEQSSDEQVTTITREFDTSQPINATTGTPPLKKETTQTRHKASDGKQTNSTHSTTNEQHYRIDQTRKEQADSIMLAKNFKKQVNTDTHLESTEKQGLSTLQWILCTLGGVAIIAFVVWLFCKFKRPLKPF